MRMRASHWQRGGEGEGEMERGRGREGKGREGEGEGEGEASLDGQIDSSLVFKSIIYI